ncbi:RIP metalloprotease RseP [Brevibacillus marinus]|uniref:RIP metalloprotease RseP n=1 Tax=Brevibacillus marinus TaxID=2496837 RepID=UPI000F81ECCA|nr:RIP metalloprotease RseP [Brevibacillus marinus]
MPLPSLDSLESILAIVVVFSLLVLVHELGHFLLAKRAGILCREFALGMGPKLFRFKRGETEYTIRALPIGGLVRMAGEDPELDVLKPRMELAVQLDEAGRVTRLILDPKQWNSPSLVRGTVVHYDLEQKLSLTLETAGEQTRYAVHPQAQLVLAEQEIQIAPLNRQFRGKSVGQRFWTIFAGPAANFLLAFVLLALLGLLYGVPSNEPQLGEVRPGGPAAQAGLLEGDRVLSIEGRPVARWQEIVDVVSRSPGETLTFVIERGGAQHSVEVTIGRNEQNRGQIMVYSAITYSPWAAVKYGAAATYEYTALILTSLGMLFTGTYGLEELSGPVGIFKMTGEFAQQGLEILIRWAAVLSINLGLFNLLPLPALDGGRLAFLGVEALRGRPVDPQKEGMVHFLGFAFLMLLILVVTWNDLQRFIFTG